MGRGRQTSAEAPSGRALARLEPRELARRVGAAAPRVAELGGWPSYIDPASLTERVPAPERPGSGFDAGIACCLDLIPRSKQRLAASLHAAYTPDAVEQVRREREEMDPDSETCWWLAACSVCEEGRLTPEQFSAQLERFEALRDDPRRRRHDARNELLAMQLRYDERDDGVAYSEFDGGMQGAYIDGHPFAVMYAPDEKLYFVGTFYETLGLEDFDWGSKRDDLDRPRSGPVHGSRQFVRCHDEDELERVLEVVKRTLG